MAKIRAALLMCALICTSSFFVLTTKAQSVPGLTPTGNLNLNTDPEFPRENTNVVVTAESYFIDLDLAQVAWFVNDKKVAEGTALKQITVNSGSIGSNTKVTAIALEGIQRVTQTIYISPAEIEILWQANTYTPPLYKSKAVVGNEAEVIIQALPNFPNVSTSNIIFYWYKDGAIIKKGRGADVLILESSINNPEKRIIVNAYSPDGKYKAEANVYLNEVFPTILMYENSPNSGLFFNHQLSGAFTPKETEFTISAFPLGFTQNKRISGDAPIIWSVNSIDVEDSYGNPDILLRKAGTGNARLSASIKSKKFITQIARKDIQISLNSKQ